MSRPKSSWGDLANFGANVYQSRQMSKMANAQAEQTAMLEMQIEGMRHHQEMEEMKREALKIARNLILEFEDAINSIKKGIQLNPILASIEVDALEMAFRESQSSGFDIDFFDELSDLERFRKIGNELSELKNVTSNLTTEQLSIKSNVISYSSQFEDIERSIILAETIPIIESRHASLSQEFSNLKPKWDQFFSHSTVVNSRTKKKKWLSITIVSLIAIIQIMALPYIPLPGLEDDFTAQSGPVSDLGGGICFGSFLLWIIIGWGTLAFFNNKLIYIPDADFEIYRLSEASDNYSYTPEDDYHQHRRDAIESVSTEKLEREIDSRRESWKLMESEYRFTDYFVLLEPTLNKCETELKMMKNEFQQLTSPLGISDPNQLKKDLQTKREYVEQYTQENLNQHTPPSDHQGHMNDDGYEISEYPTGSGSWWWKDPDTGKWNEWT